MAMQAHLAVMLPFKPRALHNWLAVAIAQSITCITRTHMQSKRTVACCQLPWEAAQRGSRQCLTVAESRCTQHAAGGPQKPQLCYVIKRLLWSA